MLSSPLDDPRVEALVAWAAGDERPDVAAALASLKDAPPRPECATALGGVAVKAYERVPRVGARDEPLGNAVVAVLGGLGGAGAVELERLWGRTGYLRPRARIEAALKLARRAATRGEGLAAVTAGGASGVHVPMNGVEAVLQPSPDMRRVRTSWLGPDGEPRAGRPAAAEKASAGERDRLAAERKRLQAELTALRAELDLELLRCQPMTIEQWVARWFSDPLRAAAARRMIWSVDDRPALPTPDGLRDVTDQPVSASADALVTLWHPVVTGPELATAWQDRLAQLGVVQPVEQADRDSIGVGEFFALCDEIGWLDQSSMRAFLRKRGWQVPWLGRFFQVPEARRELFPGGPTAVLDIAWNEDDETVSPAGLAFESAAGTQMLARELPLPWLSEIGRDVLGATTAAHL